MSRESELERALEDFLRLEWWPDSAPGPSCYLVTPVIDSRRALQNAAKLLGRESPFPSDIDGSLLIMKTVDTKKNEKTCSVSVWLGGKAYSADKPDQVPEKYQEIFREAIRKYEEKKA